MKSCPRRDHLKEKLTSQQAKRRTATSTQPKQTRQLVHTVQLMKVTHNDEPAILSLTIRERVR
eukprot:5061357-Amphidinium_carterae.1